MKNHCARRAHSWALPRDNTKASEMLALLLCKESVTEKELCRRFGHTYRSTIQTLEGDRYCWRIVNVLDEKGEIVARKLDGRHKSGDLRLDEQARHDRLVELRAKSAAQAKREGRREPKATADLHDAIEQRNAFGGANKNASQTEGA